MSNAWNSPSLYWLAFSFIEILIVFDGQRQASEVHASLYGADHRAQIFVGRIAFACRGDHFICRSLQISERNGLVRVQVGRPPLANLDISGDVETDRGNGTPIFRCVREIVDTVSRDNCPSSIGPLIDRLYDHPALKIVALPASNSFDPQSAPSRREHAKRRSAQRQDAREYILGLQAQKGGHQYAQNDHRCHDGGDHRLYRSLFPHSCAPAAVGGVYVG